MARSIPDLEDTPSAYTAFPVREEARAKVNLTLHIVGRRPDGYHELESIVMFANLCDELYFTPAAKDSLHVTGPFSSAVVGDNLVLKAKRAVTGWIGTEIYGSFTLQKNIPVAAGLGGGSSDAAAAIRVLMKVYPSTLDLARIVEKTAEIGADVPVCLLQSAAVMRGIGEDVTPIANAIPLPALLVNPRLKLSTAAVFKMLQTPACKSGLSRSESHSPNWATTEEAVRELSLGRNDLERPAVALEPAVEDVLTTLRHCKDCLLARLSGSGPTCLGLFPSQLAAAIAAEALRDSHPNWWIEPVLLS